MVFPIHLPQVALVPINVILMARLWYVLPVSSAQETVRKRYVQSEITAQMGLLWKSVIPGSGVTALGSVNP
jgi:hypothetical protein